MTSLVTGAAGSIGSAAVRLLTGSGENVIAHDLRADDIDSTDTLVRSIANNLLDSSGGGALREIIGDNGLNCVIAAHGIDGASPLRDMPSGFSRRVFDVNFGSVVSLLELTLPSLLSKGGRFVIVSSQAGLVGEANSAAYSAAKFALIGWARQLAPDLAAKGVGLHVLCPGCTESPLLTQGQERFARNSGATTTEEVRAFIDKHAASIPVGRFATPEETAGSAVYLATGAGPRPVVLAETGGEVLW
ncbi:SDR family NAD(P)-dependent oxidoreductase [Arthrobacter sp. KNU40]|uniref:SDR family NAD(P)-dependent oxidoreductase n=1 Tax=Arthrobacter sp. KNU40 TaxID=3447965 RepID=UPI003F63DD5E